MLKKMMLALVLCGLTTGAFAQAGKPADTKGTKETHGKTMPARDPKTGRFMKKGATIPDMKSGTTAKHDKPTRKMPPRDPKTGRFMKKGDSAKMPSDKHDDKKKK